MAKIDFGGVAYIATVIFDIFYSFTRKPDAHNIRA